jgi:enamine deaminase RidA (YjgF/YER057c/UK114 family)
MKLLVRAACIAALALMSAGCVSIEAGGITRKVNPGGTIPIATSVRVPAGKDIVFISGMLPAVANAEAPAGTPDAYGDTRTQGLSVLGRLEEALAAEGLTFADVVSVRVFLVGDPRLDGKMDFAGFNQAFSQYFGTDAQPNRPARTAIQVVSLPAPGALVEVDMIAAK